MTPRTHVNGLLVIDKPEGCSSFGVVAEVRRRAAGARTGHAGTLDPLATGVLVLALGRATRIVERIVGTDKRYVTVVDLSAFTATDDREAEPEPVVVTEAARPDETAVRAALGRFVGTFAQRPPAFSAVKVAGRRAYRLARRGAAPVLPARRVTVHAMELRSYAWPLVEIEIRCAKGFYVRSFARDLGTALGTGGYCRSILRTAVGPFTLETARRLEDLPERLEEGDLIPIDAALRRLEP